MKKLLLLFFSLILLVSLYPETNKLKIICDDWQPYFFPTESSYSGYTQEILTEVFKLMNVEYEYHIYPYKRAWKMINDNEGDCLINVSYKDERAEICYYPEEPLFNAEYVFFIRKEDAFRLKYDSFNDLQGHRIGVTRGYSYTDDFWNFLYDYGNYEAVVSDKINFGKLLHNRIDYFPADKVNAISYLSSINKLNKVTYLDKVVQSKPYFVIFNKKRVSKDFVDIFSETLKSFKQTEDFSTIYSKYFEIPR